jgi:hypothetical protein
VWRVPVNGGDAARVTSGGGFEAFESVDGSIVYVQRGNDVWRVPAGGSEESLVVAGGLEWGFWGVSRNDICWLDRRSRQEHLVECLAPATGQKRTIAVFESGLAIPGPPGFTISPDGRSILIARTDHGGYDLMLVENYR